MPSMADDIFESSPVQSLKVIDIEGNGLNATECVRCWLIVRVPEWLHRAFNRWRTR